MKTMITTMGLALSMLIGTSALAAKPADNINCDRLATAIIGVDGFLDANNVEFNSLGDLLSTAILDPATGGQLVALLNAFYGSAVFTSAKQVLSTAASCGLTPLLIAEIND